MKIHTILLLLLSFQFNVFAQTKTSRIVTIIIMDAGTKTPLEGVSVMVEQTGFNVQTTGIDGRVQFKIPSSMDFKRMDISFSKEGYQRKDRIPYNIGNDPENNNFLVDLQRIAGGLAPKSITKKQITLSDIKAIGNKEDGNIEVSFNVTHHYPKTVDIGIDNRSKIVVNGEYYNISSCIFGPNINKYTAKFPPKFPTKAKLYFERIDSSTPVSTIDLFQVSLASTEFDIQNIPVSWQ